MARRARSGMLTVWMNGSRVATWTAAAGGREELRYEPDWLRSEFVRPLSLSLPIVAGTATHRGAAVQAYFDNLLPDSRDIRERIAARYRTNSTGAFDLLREVGRDCVGAVQLLVPDETPQDLHTINGVPMSDSEVEGVLANVARAPGAAGYAVDDELRISIAGAQEKTALLWHRNRWCRPVGSTPSTHILKLPLGRIGNIGIDPRHSVENEWLCGQILSAFGLPTAKSTVAQFGDQRVLVVERFDRRLAQDGRWWLRLPQEDFCQALAVPSWRKYEADGGPGIATILRILDNSSTRDQDRRNFYRAQILFWMLAATDGHAKNFSIFHQSGGAYRMTPLYDVLSARPVAGAGPGKLPARKLKLAMAMAVRGANAHYRIDEIQRRHWNAMARRTGIGRDAEDLIHDLVARTPSVIATVAARLPTGFPQDVAGPILTGLEAAARQLERMPPDLA